jgi:hypothetical protein
MRGAALEHLHDSSQHAEYSAKRWIGFAESSQAVEMPEQFVCAVNEVDNHLGIRFRLRTTNSVTA